MTDIEYFGFRHIESEDKMYTDLEKARRRLQYMMNVNKYGIDKYHITKLPKRIVMGYLIQDYVELPDEKWTIPRLMWGEECGVILPCIFDVEKNRVGSFVVKDDEEAPYALSVYGKEEDEVSELFDTEMAAMRITI